MEDIEQHRKNTTPHPSDLENEYFFPPPGVFNVFESGFGDRQAFNFFRRIVFFRHFFIDSHVSGRDYMAFLVTSKPYHFFDSSLRVPSLCIPSNTSLIFWVN